MKIAAFLFTLFTTTVALTATMDDQTLAKLTQRAKQGNAEAQYHLGMMYNNGVGGAKQDSAQAFAWFEKSAAGKDPLGAYKVGCYYAGQFPGAVDPDSEKAMAFKTSAADAGYALAQHDLGVIYFKRGDFEQAGKWWKMAADQGFPPAAHNLSTLYFEGKGVAQDAILAYAYFKISQQPGRQGLTAKGQAGLDRIAEKMTSDEVRQAEKYIITWRAKPTEVTTRAGNAMARIEELVKGMKPGISG